MDSKRKSRKRPGGHTHDPEGLYYASLERIEDARLARNEQHWVAAMYLAGLAVECILQALALRDYPRHDARHDLTQWLGRCPTTLQETLKSTAARADWNRVRTVWYNAMRYVSESGLLGYLRKTGRAHGIKGGREAILRKNVELLVKSASAVHIKGLNTWRRFSTR